MAYTPDALDDTKPVAGTHLLSSAALEFRTIKTKLIEFQTEKTVTLPAVAARVSSLEAGKAVKLTGSGNYTVPAGVTLLRVQMAGGGTCGLTYQSHYGYDHSRLRMEQTLAPTLTAYVTVAPGDIIAYSVGTNEAIHSVAVTYWDYETITEATASTFGAITAPPALHTVGYEENINHLAAIADKMAGKFYPVRFTYASVADSSEVITAGAGAFISVSY